MSCPKGILCYYAKRQTPKPIDDATFDSDAAAYCNGNHKECAIYIVMDRIGFLRVPKHLTPHDKTGAAQILS